MGAAISRKSHPQPTLVPFYQVSLAYLIYETLLGALWVSCMFVFKFGITDAAIGLEYRQFNEASLFHFTAAITMWTVVQQTLNDNSVSWWALIPIFVAMGSDVSQLLSASVLYLTSNIPWAWRLSIAQSIVQLIGSFSALCIYLIVFLFPCSRPRDLPTPVAFRKEAQDFKQGRKKRGTTEPLLSDKLQ